MHTHLILSQNWNPYYIQLLQEIILTTFSKNRIHKISMLENQEHHQFFPASCPPYCLFLFDTWYDLQESPKECNFYKSNWYKIP